MILIYSRPDDETANLVEARLEARGEEVVRVSAAILGAGAKLSLTVAPRGQSSATCAISGTATDLARTSVGYVRRPGYAPVDPRISDRRLAASAAADGGRFLRETLEILVGRWLPGRPSLIATLEDNKVRELTVAAAVGLRVPPTLVTTEPEAVFAFYREHDGRIISKRYNACQIPLDSCDDIGVPTRPVSVRDLKFVDTVRVAPSLFQAYVPKAVELRVTVVGCRVFAAEIRSQGSHRTVHDWRHYDRRNAPYVIHELPHDVEASIVTLTATLGLSYAAVDMVVTPGGDYVFLEINPAGQFLFVEQVTELPISEAICDWLVAAGGQAAPTSRIAQGATL